MSAGRGMADARPPVQRPLARIIGRGLSLLLLGLILIGAYASTRYQPTPLWVEFVRTAAMLLFLALWLFPSPSPPISEEDETPPLSPRRRMIVGALALLITAILAGETYLLRVTDIPQRDLVLALPAVIVLLGVIALVLPRNPEAPIDMRPAWAIVAVILAILVYFIFSQ